MSVKSYNISKKKALIGMVLKIGIESHASSLLYFVSEIHTAQCTIYPKWSHVSCTEYVP